MNFKELLPIDNNVQKYFDYSQTVNAMHYIFNREYIVLERSIIYIIIIVV